MKRVFRTRITRSDSPEDSENPLSSRPYDSISIHLGTNSLLILLPFLVCAYATYSQGLLNWGYLKGLDSNLAFIIGLLSITLGVIFYKFWKFGEQSVFSFHLMHSRHLPRDMVKIFTYQNLSFALGSHSKLQRTELPSLLRKFMCVAIFFFVILSTLDNRGFNKLKSLPKNVFSSNADYCPEKEEEDLESIVPMQGCALLIKAYKLGYAKDLGQCAPKKISPIDLEICTKRRRDEPYLHYAARLLTSSFERFRETLSAGKIDKIEQGLKLQWQKKEVLKDYQLYAMSAAPRASHHIWTNLPYPNSELRHTLVDIFSPSHCLDEFQNQTNTVPLDENDESKDSQLLQHVYGQLLFNPKVKRTVAFCKEYKIHWKSEIDVCDRLVDNPHKVLTEFNVLSEVEMVLKRHEITGEISKLDEELQSLGEKNKQTVKTLQEAGTKRASKKRIDTSKIAKNKRLRKKNELVSFGCFMQRDNGRIQHSERSLTLDNTIFSVRTHQFPKIDKLGESQIAMYKQFAKSLNKNFHYSQYNSRSNLDIQRDENKVNDTEQSQFLKNEEYLLSRLEVLNDTDIFLGNNWVLEREDLLEVYPFHVHLQNYVESFRVEYQRDHGRL